LNYKIDALTWGIKASSKRKLEIDKLFETPLLDQNEIDQKTSSTHHPEFNQC